MDSPKKATLKHLEFQLQREKSVTKGWEEKCKSLQAQVAQLEQDNAELRRKKLLLTEEAKKAAKLDERIHTVLHSKELEAKDAIINQERSLATAAREETEEIRRNANISIDAWKAAEVQWIAEQTALNNVIEHQRTELASLQQRLNAKQQEAGEAMLNLRKESERCEKLQAFQGKLEAELHLMREKVEKLQNQNFELEQKIYQLDFAGEKQKETLDLKDTELLTMKAQVEKLLAAEEKMEQTINSLYARIDAAKIANLESKSANEKLFCDVTEARRENQRMNFQIESLKRDLELSSQNQETLKKSLDDLREKYHTEKDILKERNIEVRQHELTISHLNVELKKLESQCAEWFFRSSELETQLQQKNEEIKSMLANLDSSQAENNELNEEINNIKNKLDRKDEEFVLVRSQLEDRIEAITSDLKNMEQEVCVRQGVINDLTSQLGLLHEKSVEYQGKMLKDSGSVTKARHEIAHQYGELQAKERDFLALSCLYEKQEDIITCFEDLVRILGSERTSLQSLLQITSDMSSARQNLVKNLETKTTYYEERHGHLLENLKALNEQIENLRMEGQANLQVNKAQNEELALLKTQLSSARAATDEFQQEIRRLNSTLLRLQDEKAALNQHGALKIAELEKLLGFIAHRGEANIFRFDDRLCAVADAFGKKVDLFVEGVLLTFQNASVQLKNAVAAKAAAESKHIEMTTLLEELKSSNNRNILMAEKEAVNLERIQSLELQLQVLSEKEKKTSFHLNTLLRRFEDEQKSFNAMKKELDAALLGERAKREYMEKENQKVRHGLEYELQRKHQYKLALGEVKHLREESDRCRQKEKQSALEAIQAANEEAEYWVKSFDTLKSMMESSLRHGTGMPPIDPQTCNRLEATKARISGVLQTHNTNLSPVNPEKHKRRKIDFCE